MSSVVDAFFAGRVFESGTATRRTTLRHTHLAENPFVIVMWRLGGERFRAAAIAWGRPGEPFKLAVPGEPRNRDLYFAALKPFADDLCDAVAATAVAREERRHGQRVDHLPTNALQIVVANKGTVAALNLLGRYLAYLSDRSGVAPDPRLIEAGKHLRFYAKRARVPGQSLIVPIDQLLAEHWATLLSPFERANLASLDAQIEPPAGTHAFDAAADAERNARIGPEPTEDVDRVTSDLVQEFNAERAGNADWHALQPELAPLVAHYRDLVEPVWSVIERSVQRERRLPAAPSVVRRFEADREAFGLHVDWVGAGNRYRTTETPRQAAMSLRRLEDAQNRYEAERAIEDPACMIPYLLDGEAIRGEVVKVDQVPVLVNVQTRPRDVITLDTDDPVVMPEGKHLWWTQTADDEPWRVMSIEPQGSGSRVVLQLTAAPRPDRQPALRARITLSTLTTKTRFNLPLSQTAPWTHRPAVPPPPPTAIDAGDGDPPSPPVDGSTVDDPGAYA